MTVFPGFGMSLVGSFFPKDFEKNALKAAREQLGDFVKQHIPDDLSVAKSVDEGTIYERVLAAADRLGVDLIVVGAHRPELKDYLIGPNSARIVRHAECSVMLVR